MKKFLALIISLSMILMCVPGLSLAALADEDGITGAGTQADPYIINSADDFNAFFSADGANKDYSGYPYFKQTEDIDLGEFSPNYSKNHSVHYFGEGNTLTYTISGSGKEYVGLFPTFWSGTINNLKVAGSITAGGSKATGALVGKAAYITVNDCESSVDISGINNWGSGFLGVSDPGYPAGDIKFNNCKYTGNINGSYNIHAGFLATGHAKFVGCEFAGYVHGTYTTAGFVATATGSVTIEKSKVTGTVDTNWNTAQSGGFISQVNTTEEIKISESINEGLVNYNGTSSETALPSVGGFISSVSTDGANITIENCYNKGTIATKKTATKASAVNASNGANAMVATITVTNFFDATNAGISAVANAADGSTVTETGVYDKAGIAAYASTLPEGYDAEIWTKGTAKNAHPLLLNNMPPVLPGDTEDKPIEIADAADFISYFGQGGANAAKIDDGLFFKQTGNFTLDSSYVPSTTAFTGTYDGDIYTITNNMTQTAVDQGAFGKVTNATIKNVTVDGTFTSSKNNFGAVAGYATNSKFIDCVNNASVSGAGGGDGGLGGIAGYATSGCEFVNCVNNGHLDRNYATAGGIVGMGGGTFTGCTNNGLIDPRRWVGGIIAYVNEATTITKCANYGELKAEGYDGAVGGLIGYVNADVAINVSESINEGSIYVGGSAASSYAPIAGLIGSVVKANTAGITVTDSINKGTVTGSFDTRAGAVALAATANVTVKNFYDITSGAKVVDGSGVEGSTITETGTYTDAALLTTLPASFSEDIWTIDTRPGAYKYPQLKAFPEVYEDPDGKPDAEGRIQILSGEMFANYFGNGENPVDINDFKSAKFIQLDDIELPANYVPRAEQPYAITYDGNGFEIYADIKLENIPEGRTSYIGVFGTLTYQKILNVTTRGEINLGDAAFEYVGGIAGSANGDKFVNCTNYINITAPASKYVGGITGQQGNINGSTGNKNYGNIVAAEDVGGYAGFASVYNPFTDFVNYGNITAPNTVGGVFGRMYKANDNANYPVMPIEKVANKGNITAKNINAGGIIGYVGNASYKVSESYNAGNILGSTYNTAAIIASTEGTSAQIVVENCFNTGDISTSAEVASIASVANNVDATVGGITVTNYYDAANKDIQLVCTTHPVTGITTGTVVSVANAFILNANIKLDKGASIIASELEAFDFGANWAVKEGYRFPQLVNVAYVGSDIVDVAPAAIAAGTAAVVDETVELAGETYNNAAVFAAKILGDAAKYGFEVTYTNSGKVETIYAENAVNGAFGLLVYNIAEDSEIIVKSFVEFNDVKYYGAAQKAFFAAPVAE